jgi:hypothetical protein
MSGKAAKRRKATSSSSETARNVKARASKGKMVDEEIIRRMEKKGADVSCLEEEQLFRVICSYGDAAWKELEDWADDLPDNTDPLLIAQFAPPPNIAATALCPPAAQGLPLQNECNAILGHLSPLMMANSEGGNPVIGGVVAPVLPVQFHHCQVAMSKVFEFIQQPQAQFPTLNALDSKSYICTIFHIWANVVFSVAVFKP